VAESGVARRAKRNRQILALLRAGTTSFQAVGADYGLSGERVRQIARKLGYAGRQRSPLWPPDADKRLRKLVRTGLSASVSCCSGKSAALPRWLSLSHRVAVPHAVACSRQNAVTPCTAPAFVVPRPIDNDVPPVTKLRAG
jgi:hypothetical protein